MYCISSERYLDGNCTLKGPSKVAHLSNPATRSLEMWISRGLFIQSRLRAGLTIALFGRISQKKYFQEIVSTASVPCPLTGVQQQAPGIEPRSTAQSDVLHILGNGISHVLTTVQYPSMIYRTCQLPGMETLIRSSAIRSCRPNLRNDWRLAWDFWFHNIALRFCQLKFRFRAAKTGILLESWTRFSGKIYFDSIYFLYDCCELNSQFWDICVRGSSITRQQRKKKVPKKSRARRIQNRSCDQLLRKHWKQCDMSWCLSPQSALSCSRAIADVSMAWVTVCAYAAPCGT